MGLHMEDYVAIRFRKEYNTWQVYWNNPITKKRESKSYSNHKEAEKANSLILHRLKYEPESFRLRDVTEDAKNTSSITMAQVYEEYLVEKNMQRLDEKSNRVHFKYILENYGTKDIKEISQTDLEVIKRYYVANNNVATAYKRLCLLRSVLNYACEKNYLDSFTFPKLPKPIYQKFIPPTKEELSAIYQVAAPHLKRVIILGMYFGIRIGSSELFKLTWEHVDLENKVIHVPGSLKNTNCLLRDVPIKSDLLPLIKSWRADDQKKNIAYVVNFRGKKLRDIHAAWRHALKKAGITRRIRLYDLRHFFATELIANGIDIGTVAKLLGHRDPLMLLKHYQYVRDLQKQKAVDLLPDTLCHIDVPQEDFDQKDP